MICNLYHFFSETIQTNEMLVTETFGKTLHALHTDCEQFSTATVML